MSDYDDTPKGDREQWAEMEAKFCDQQAAEYRGPLLDGWKKRGDYADGAMKQVECLIYAEAWERMAWHLRQPRRIRIERENHP